MRRRRFVVLCGTVLLAGCGGDTDGDASTSTAEDFQPEIDFQSCSEVTVDAEDAYTAVGLGLVDGNTTMHDEGYEGENSFEANSPINEVVIWREGGGKHSIQNPDVDSCPQPN